MANQTVTTDSNHDSDGVLGLANGETYTLNGAKLTINGDVRWGQNAAVFAAITVSSSLGGGVIIDGSQVWEIPFSASSGNVPSLASLGSNGVTGGTSGATGELFRVWATGSLTPAAAGGAMPATGWIKLRSKTGTFVDGETITLPGGATITVNSSTGGKRSWIHVVAQEVNSLTLPRRGSFTVTGDWYELGTTNGADGQTFQFPVTDCCPALQIETAPGSGVYEWWLNAGARWAQNNQFISTDVRGKYFGQDASTGVITIAYRGTPNCGMKPPSGCKVRVPNVILGCTTATDYTVNTINGTTTSRYRFSWSGGGSGNVSINYACCNWYLAFDTNLVLSVQNSAILHVLNIDNSLGAPTVKNVAIGLYGATNVAAMTTNNLFFGGTFEDVRAVRYAAITATVAGSSMNNVYNATFTRTQWEMFGNTSVGLRSGTNNYAFYLGGCYDITINDISCIGGGSLWISGGARISATNCKQADVFVSSTSTSQGVFSFNISGYADSVTVTGLSHFGGLSNVHSYAGIASLTNVSNITITDVGTSSDALTTGADATYAIRGFAALQANSFNTTFRRWYLTLCNAAFTATANTHSGVVLENLYQTSSLNYQVGTNNTLAKSCRWGISVGSGISNQYGTHWSDHFTADTTGNVCIACNEPTALSSTQCDTSGLSQSPAFTATTAVSMPSLNDTIVWTMPYFMRGHTGFANTTPTKTGTNTANIALSFQYDTGSGWNGSWIDMTGANLAAVGAIDPTMGIKIKVRAVTTTANANNLLRYVFWSTTTTSTAQKNLHPAPGATLTVQGLVPYSRVKVYRVDTGAVLASNTSGAGTSITFTDIQYSGAVYVEARKASAATYYKPWISQTTISSSAPVTVTALQEAD